MSIKGGRSRLWFWIVGVVGIACLSGYYLFFWKSAGRTYDPPKLSFDGGSEALQNTIVVPTMIESLIAQLRSPNKDPNPKLDNRLGIPKEYDFQAEKRVLAAQQKLIEVGKVAFPNLIEHINDKAFSHSMIGTTAVLVLGRSVGQACFDIIEKQVDIAGMTYKSRQGADGQWHTYRGYFSQFSSKGEHYSQDGLRRWWRSHRHQSVKEMQMDAMRWAIDREKRIGFPGPRDEEHYLRPLQSKLRELTQASSSRSRK
jgi:hypothetical protein